MAHLLAKRSFAVGAFCATATAAKAIIRSTDHAILFFILSPLIFQNIFRDSFGVDQWIRCITKSLSGGLSKDRVSRGSGSLLAIPA
jgi:hypothetical protein